MKFLKSVIPVLLLILFSCSGSDTAKIEKQIINKALVLIELDSLKFQDNEKSGEIFIKMNSKDVNSGIVIAFGGCNEISGSYKNNKNGLPKFYLMMTDRYCDKSDNEKKLVELLNNVSLIEILEGNVAYFQSDKPKHYGKFKIKE